MKKKRTLSWEDLRIFLELSRHNSIHAASKKLGVDHATVGRHLARVEAGVGMKLVERTKSGFRVRVEAAELLRHIEHMELYAQLLVSSAAQKKQGFDQVRVATMEGLASGYLAPRMLLLQASHPNIKIELVSTPLAVDVTRREADIFLSFFDPRPRGLRSQKIGEFSLHLYCSNAYVKRRGLPKSEGDLNDHEYVGYIDELLAIDAVRWLSDLVPNPKVMFYSNSILAQRAAAISGIGIVMLPTFVGAAIKDLQPIMPSRFFVKRDVWMSVGIDPDLISPVRAVTTFLVDLFKRDQHFLHSPFEKHSRAP